MSKRLIVIAVMLIMLSIIAATTLVFVVQTNQAMPNIAKTAEAETNATLIATLKAGS